MNILPRMRLAALFVLFVPLVGCLGWGDMFAPRRTVAGDYFLMEAFGTVSDPFVTCHSIPIG